MKRRLEKFPDRYAAGHYLAQQLLEYKNNPDVIVLALPRGGVPVAYEVAIALSVPLDIFVVRKLGVPSQEELAFGAIAMDDNLVFNDEIVKNFNLSATQIEQIQKAEKLELQRRNIKYRGNKPLPKLNNKIIILVDDGIATGATMRVAIKALHQYKPTKIIVAVPVAASSTCEEIALLVNKIICPLQPKNFYAVGAWYENFSQTEDEEVASLLAKF